MESKRKFEAVKENVSGDFYVEHGCCTLCGMPSVIAPNLFGGIDDKGKVTHEQCFVKKQPDNPIELTQMIETFESQDLDCIRYSGHDKNIKDRIILAGEKNQIDWD